MAKPPAKVQKGRPTGYKPEYAKLAVAFLADGFSVAALAGHIGVSRAAVYRWADERPEFRDALKAGQAASALWWERCARDLATTGQGNASMIIFALKNRVADEWRDKAAVEVSGPDGSPVAVTNITRVIVDPKA